MPRATSIGAAVVPLFLAALLWPVCAHAVESGADDDYPVADAPIGLQTPITNAGQTFPLTSVPQLSSDSNASAKLYIDFVGQTSSGWGSLSPGTTPAYDADGDPTTFSSTEIANMNEMWSRVSEKYSPFNLDVTTIKPPADYAGKTITVVVGGTGSWLGAAAGGTSYVGSFANPSSSMPNISYVFAANLLNAPQYVSEAIAHEAGHSFGLQHHTDYDIHGNRIIQNSQISGNPIGYYQINIGQPVTGPTSKAPIMGDSYYAERGIWADTTYDQGDGVANPKLQDDLAILSNGTNNFGYRTDDHMGLDPMTINNGALHASGIIENTADVDSFSFTTTTAGQWNVAVNVAPFGAMLDASADLRNADGSVIMTAATSSLSELMTTSLAAGTTYIVDVFSAGQYGDIGQYSITAALVPEPSIVAIGFAGMLLFRRRRVR